MSILKITKAGVSYDKPRIGDLQYGTFVTDVPAGNVCVYVKVKKKTAKGFCGLSVNWSKGHCILMNIQYGTFREIEESTPVKPLIPELTVSSLPPSRYNEVYKTIYEIG